MNLCMHCGYTWVPRVELPKMCPACLSRKWNRKSLELEDNEVCDDDVDGDEGDDILDNLPPHTTCAVCRMEYPNCVCGSQEGKEGRRRRK